jgi:actin, other eukaryote
MKILTERGYQFDSYQQREMVNNIKENLGYVAIDFENEMKIASTSNKIEKEWELPDGKKIKIGNERFRCTEVLFQPSLLGYGVCGVHEGVNNSIYKFEVDYKKELSKNILLTGGSTLFQGFGSRLKKELESLLPSGFDINVIENENRRYLPFIGSAILASSDYFYDKCISKSEYEEYGPTIVNKKCKN